MSRLEQSIRDSLRDNATHLALARVPTSDELAVVLRHRRARVLGVAGSVIAVIALVVGLVVALRMTSSGRTARSADDTHAPASLARDFVASTYEGIVFRHPAAWRAVPVTFVTGGYTPSAYWTNQPTGAECHRLSANSGQCGPPVESVATTGVLVTVVDMPLDTGRFHANTMIAGHQASIVRSACTLPPDCYPGATRAITATIKIAGNFSADRINTLQLQAVFGTDARTLEATMLHVLRTAAKA